ncbi:OmpA family protein [Reichenbachiella ulvae]|uniref:OmpA family protein n=1 Tax=Reichenbachiella ulvae TaxID=2980104 RepID=A0ABT3CQ15_9BACT|nr:OmpA family protein [Reichenbachiella ulvae]MCV9385810.1 OmpA family protein [Reichenbachiella ulvae]
MNTVKKFFTLFYAFVVLLCAWNAQAQNNSDKEEMIQKADHHFYNEEFKKALLLYNQILHEYPDNHYIQYHKHIANHLIYGHESTMDSLREYERNEGKTDKFYNYWLGRIHYKSYEFDLSEKHYQAFLDLEAYKTEEITNEAKKRLEQTKRARQFYLNTNDYEVINMGPPINSSAADISPAFFADHNELIFSSSRLKPSHPLKEETKGVFTIFHCINTGSSWQKPTALKELGTFEENNAKIEVVNNDGRLFMYIKDGDRSNLFYSQPNGEDWKVPTEFDPKLKEAHIASHFFINDEETVIYFSSPSPRGDLDLYQTHFEPGSQSWSSPVPVPGDINTSADEDSPYLSHDGKSIYYSSNNPDLSIGGFDIIQSEWNAASNSWSKVKNVGFPINTIDNEINLQLNPDNISGFLSSDRIHGKGDYDIYYFHKHGKVIAKGTVYDNSTGKPIPEAQVDMRPVTNADEHFKTYTDANGQYSMEIFSKELFDADITVLGHKAYSEQVVSDHGDRNRLFVQDFHIQVPEAIEETDYLALFDRNKESQYEKLDMMGSKFRAGQKVMLKNIYFDVHSAHLTQESNDALNHLYQTLKNSPKLKVEIGGHTDNTGTLAANMALSLERANAVKDYLTSKGIAASRLITKGYGPNQPLASNDDEENGRELNRRIEVRVLN